MTTGQVAAVVVTVIVAVAVIAFLLSIRRQDHPEDTATHQSPDRTDGWAPTHPYPRGDRPGGPASEAMAVAGPGEIIPGENVGGPDVAGADLRNRHRAGPDQR